MSIFSESKSTIKEIWRTSFHLYRKSFSRVWHIVAIASSGLILSFLINAYYKNHGIDSKIINTVAPIALLLINVYLTSLLLLITYNVGLGKKETWKNLLPVINKKFIKIITSMLIVVLLYMLGLIAFILPGVFLFVLFAMAQPLILFDDHNIMASIKGSSKLVWKNWWRTFVIIFPLLLISYWISVSISYAVVQQKWYMLGIDLMIGILLYPFFYACMITIFNDLKIRKNRGPITVKAIK